MSNFIQFLQLLSLDEERGERDVPTALKILARIQKNKKMSVGNDEMRNIIPRVKWEQKTHKGSSIGYHTFKEHGQMRDVNVHSIDTAQHTVVPSVVAKKLKGTWKHHDPDVPYFIHDPDTGRHRLYDGNHRAVEARLRRSKTLKGLVIDADKTIKYDD